MSNTFRSQIEGNSFICELDSICFYYWYEFQQLFIEQWCTCFNLFIWFCNCYYQKENCDFYQHFSLEYLNITKMNNLFQFFVSFKYKMELPKLWSRFVCKLMNNIILPVCEHRHLTNVIRLFKSFSQMWLKTNSKWNDMTEPFIFFTKQFQWIYVLY